jgi:hypothetical protein
MAGSTQYTIAVQLDNGMSFSVVFGPLPGLPVELEDALAAAASRAVRDFGWSSIQGVTPQPTSATATLTRTDTVDTAVPL